MKDIDFDELDRAVNSLMKTVPSDKTEPTDAGHSASVATTASLDDSQEATVAYESKTTPDPVAQNEIITHESELTKVSIPQDSATTLDVPVTPAEEPTEELASLYAGESQQVTTAVTTPTTAPVARRGRFMDMVRPTASREARPAVSTRVSRQGVDLQPTAPAPVETPKEEEISPSPSAMTAAPVVETVESQDMIEDTSAVAGITDDTPPLTSPFLTDAKVEKRPLGRPYEPTPASPAVDLTAELSQSSETPAVEAYPSLREDPISPNKDAQIPEQPLPAELGSELLSIETSTENLPQEPIPAAPAESYITPSPSNSESGVSALGAARVMATASIPQQYKVHAPKAEEAPTGAIYDSQPLTQSDKRRPKWLWAAIFAAIVLLGAAGGAAVYYLGLI